MIKKIYHISGFDCANCAAKAEAHLNKQNNISYARMDFAGNRLYVTYKDQEWDVEKLSKCIAEVESDPLEIYESDGSVVSNAHIFTKNMWILLGRIIFSSLITIVCIFLLGKSEFNILRFVLYCIAILVIIYDVVFKVIKHIINRENIIDHNLLITIAALGAFTLSILNINSDDSIRRISDTYTIAVDETMEAAMVVILFQIGRIIESVATNKSKAAVMAAVSLRVDYANLWTINGVRKVRPEELSIKDKIVVSTGELIPIDGNVIEGQAYVDSSSLTGEYVPVNAVPGSYVCGGCLVKSGSIIVEVDKVYADSTVSKILTLIASGGESKSKADDFIAKFAKWYTPVVVIISLLVLLIGGLITSNWILYVNKSLEVLVTGCPCAIVISVPLAYFSAIGLASKNGIVIKGANYLDKLCELGKLITDKTGTLTHGSFSIQKIYAVSGNDEKLLDYLYASECLSSHPIGKAICHGKNLKKLSSEVKSFKEEAGLGVSCSFKNHTIISGNEKWLRENQVDFEINNSVGTTVYCAVDGVFIGYVLLADEIKDDAQPMVNLLHKENVEIILLTGDHEDNARDICNKLGIDRWHSELLPEQKVKILIDEMDDYDKATAFIGDGINDAPSIIKSDIGIAMGGIGSDVAVENADVVIMNDDPAKVYDSMRIAKMARGTSLFNIIFALLVKVAVALLAIFQIQMSNTLMMVIAVMADTGLTVLLVINSLLLLYRKVKR